MARKRPVFFAGIQSFLNRVGLPPLAKGVKRKLSKGGKGGIPPNLGGKGGKWLIFIFCVLLGFLFALSLPGRSLEPPAIASDPLQLMLQGKEFYDRGEFDRAASAWENAAEAYDDLENGEKMLENRINQSQALQAIGFYPQACHALVQGLDFKWLDCNSLSRNNSPLLEEIKSKIATLKNNSQSVSLTEAIAMRGLGELLQRMGQLETAKDLLGLSLQVAENANSPQQESAAMLSFANSLRAIQTQKRNRREYDEISDAIENKSTAEILQPYQEVFELYETSAQISSAPLLTQIQAQLNQLSLLWELYDWWQEQVQERDDSPLNPPNLGDFRRDENVSPLNPPNLGDFRRDDSPLNPPNLGDFWSELQWELVGRMERLWPKILLDFQDLPPTRSGLYARINFAQTLIKIKKSNITTSPSLSWPQIEQFLTVTAQQAETIQDSRSQSYALGYLGQVAETQAYALGYLGQVAESRSQVNKAIAFTEQALFFAQNRDNNIDAREVKYLWQWQLGRLQKQNGNIKPALGMYAGAVNTLKSLREDLVANNREIQLDFRQQVEPVYQDLAGLLLRREVTAETVQNLTIPNPGLDLSSQAEQSSSSEKSKDPIELARQAIESLQIAELDNFFQDPCSEETDEAIKVDEIDEKAAVIYPLVLPDDRLELIFALPGQDLRHYPVDAKAKEVNTAIETIYDRLYNKSKRVRDKSPYWLVVRQSPPDIQTLMEGLDPLLEHLKQAYDWLIAPLEDDLASQNIETLVFVLNGSLQRLPISALYDGEQYLIEKYGVVLAPSLELIDRNKSDTDPKNIKVLAAGLSEERNVNGQEFKALGGVENELDLIKQIFPKSEKLLNNKFKEDRLIQKINSSDFTIVHLATHGIFSSQSEKTFILTGDDVGEDGDNIININELEQILKSENSVRKKAIDLLVLSACNTATGDDRAVLGLAGVALRSGARSTLAGLWPVGDETTPKLMKDFYTGLKAGQSKVEALRNAQINLIKRNDKNHRKHPFYWAPYVLVGNWR
jgi:CHAT domain-containing protein/tetratricopeptide (TPR) repeat protein